MADCSDSRYNLANEGNRLFHKLAGARMHTVELLEEALKTARKLGFMVRQDWLNGAGGACEIKGKRVLFVDLSLPTIEQLDQVLAAIKQANPELSEISPGLRRQLDRAKAA